MNNIFVSVVIPAYNEAKRIGRTLTSIKTYFAKNGMSYEVIVVDDGSTDGTPEVVRRLGHGIENLTVLVNAENAGKGFSVNRGMSAAKGKVRLFMDADNSVDISHLDAFLLETDRGAEVVIGSINIDRTHVTEHNGWHRRILGSFANTLIQTLAVPGIGDTQRGFKLFTEKAAEIIFPKQTIARFGFDIEVLVIARMYGLKIQEVSVHWDNPAGSSVTAMSYVQTLTELLRIVFNRLTGAYAAGARSKISIHTHPAA